MFGEDVEVKIGKIISGGQTGADRAALDAAIACGVPHGGWCPKGRLAEAGSIPGKYNLRETEEADYPVRTRANVEAADLTLIFSRGPLTGGSLLTLEFAKAARKPCVHMNLCAGFQGLEKRGQALRQFFQTSEKTGRKVPRFGKISLNVAGPRASNDPGIYAAVYAAMISLLRRG